MKLSLLEENEEDDADDEWMDADEEEEEEEDDDWLGGGGWTFGSAPPQQVQLQDPSFHPLPPVLAQVDSEKVDVDVAEHLHQAYRLVSILSA